ncbi:hypothetical protein KKH81_02965 [Patescibacteria group bacterium]|nr:hypothetical protein [Patescibacteria group bacterium]
MVEATGTFQKVIIARILCEPPIKNPFIDLSLYPDIPVFFLAGPLQGAPDYHPEVYRLLCERLKKFILVIPTRYEPDHPLCQHRLDGEPDRFLRQRHFEEHYIKYVRRAPMEHTAGGALMINLCLQTTPRTDGRNFSTDTWREASATYAHLEHDPWLGVVVRAESVHPEAEMLLDCYEAARIDFVFHRTLEQMVDEAITYVWKK